MEALSINETPDSDERGSNMSSVHECIVSVVVPHCCPVDQWLHDDDIGRCLQLVDSGCELVVTLACGCPLIAFRRTL